MPRRARPWRRRALRAGGPGALGPDRQGRHQRCCAAEQHARHSRLQGADRRRNGAGDQEEQQHSVRASGDVPSHRRGQRDAQRDHEQQRGGRDRARTQQFRAQPAQRRSRSQARSRVPGHADRRRTRPAPAGRLRPASRTPRAPGRRSRSSPGRSRSSSRSRPSVRAAAGPKMPATLCRNRRGANPLGVTVGGRGLHAAVASMPSSAALPRSGPPHRA